MWRESLIDIENTKFKNIKIEKILNYMPAGNDVFECQGYYKNKKQSFFIKSERGSFANFQTEKELLPKLKGKFKVPELLEDGKINDHTYLITKKLEGERLSTLINKDKNINKKEYLYNYGKTLGQIHKQKIKASKAFQRPVNDYPKENQNQDEYSKQIINYLKETKPKINYQTFIHGDYHYANILNQNKQISGILDWEYSGMGFKEQDIAWALILRPSSNIMENKEDIEAFLEGYKTENTYEKDKLNWCLLNGYIHFYLMNKTNEEYKQKLKTLINNLKLMKK